jgi:hypothetical protein
MAVRDPRPIAPADKVGKYVGHVREVLEAGRRVIPPRLPCVRVFAVVPLLRLLCAGCVDFALVVAFALFGVLEELIGRGEFLEPLLGIGVAGVEIRMQLLGELAVGLADLGLRCVLGDAEGLVWIVAHDFAPLPALRTASFCTNVPIKSDTICHGQTRQGAMFDSMVQRY